MLQPQPTSRLLPRMPRSYFYPITGQPTMELALDYVRRELHDETISPITGVEAVPGGFHVFTAGCTCPRCQTPF